MAKNRLTVSIVTFALILSSAQAAVPIYRIGADETLPDITVIGSRPWVGDTLGTYTPASSFAFQTMPNADSVDVVDTMPRRSEPGCPREAEVMSKTTEQIAAAVVSGASPPGREIMPGTQWGDPRYSAPGWIKMQVTEYIHETRPPSPTLKWTVSLHYMYNVITRDSGDMKLVNSLAKGCGPGSTIGI